MSYKIGFTNGVFDVLHAGHISLLQRARCKVDLLVVGINSDESVKRIKGKNRPIYNQRDRAYVLRSLGCVHSVIVFNEDTPERLIRELEPDILFKGGDWKKKDVVGAKFVKKVVIIPYKKGYSTSSLIKKIKDK